MGGKLGGGAEDGGGGKGGGEGSCRVLEVARLPVTKPETKLEALVEIEGARARARVLVESIVPCENLRLISLRGDEY